MPTLALFFLIGYIAFELLSFSIWVSYFGFFSLFCEIVFSGIAGLWLWNSHTRSLSSSLNEIIHFVYEGRILDLLKSNMLFFLGAILLIAPGLLSDSVGIICIVASFLSSPKPSDFVRDYRAQEDFTFDEKPNDEDIIEVEIIEESSKQNKAIQKDKND